MRIFAELKTQSRAAVDALVAELVRTGTKDRTTIICFSRDVVAYAATKGVDCAWLVCCEKPEQVLELDVPAGCALDVNCAALDENTVKALHERGGDCLLLDGCRDRANLKRWPVFRLMVLPATIFHFLKK